MLAQPRLVLFEMMRVPFGDDVEDRAVRRRAARPARGARCAATAAARPCPNPAAISPLRIFSSVDLPVPLRPMTDTRSRGSICRATSSSSGRCPKAIDTPSSETRGIPSTYHAELQNWRVGEIGGCVSYDTPMRPMPFVIAALAVVCVATLVGAAAPDLRLPGDGEAPRAAARAQARRAGDVDRASRRLRRSACRYIRYEVMRAGGIDLGVVEVLREPVPESFDAAILHQGRARVARALQGDVPRRRRGDHDAGRDHDRIPRTSRCRTG